MTLKAFFSFFICRSTPPSFQYGFVWPGSDLKSWSPLHASSTVLFCEGLGAVVKEPMALPDRRPAKRKKYRLPGFRPLMRAWTVLSCDFRARATSPCTSFVNRLFRATTSEYRPLFFALPHSTALLEVTSPAVTPYEKPRAANAEGAAASSRMVRASGIRRFMRMGTPHPMEGCGGAPVGCRP